MKPLELSDIIPGSVFRCIANNGSWNMIDTATKDGIILSNSKIITYKELFEDEHYEILIPGKEWKKWRKFSIID